MVGEKRRGKAILSARVNKSEDFSEDERRKLIQEIGRKLNRHPRPSLEESLFICRIGRKIISVGFAVNHAGLVAAPYYSPPECEISNLLGTSFAEVELVEQGKYLSIVKIGADTTGLVPSYIRDGVGLFDKYESERFFCIDLRGRLVKCQMIGTDLAGLPVKVGEEFYHVEGGSLLFLGEAPMRTVPGPVVTNKGEIVGFNFAEAAVELSRARNQETGEFVGNYGKCLYQPPEIVTPKGDSPTRRFSDSRWRTMEVRHGHPAPG